jgi:hypothetical protein
LPPLNGVPVVSSPPPGRRGREHPRFDAPAAFTGFRSTSGSSSLFGSGTKSRPRRIRWDHFQPPLVESSISLDSGHWVCWWRLAAGYRHSGFQRHLGRARHQWSDTDLQTSWRAVLQRRPVHAGSSGSAVTSLPCSPKTA